MTLDSSHQRPLCSIDDLDTPAILLEKERLQENIGRMQTLAESHHLALRPHIKTHKSVHLAKLQMEAGAVGIAVAKLSEAEVFAAAGFGDIQIANQVVGSKKISRLGRLARTSTVSVAVDSAENVLAIASSFAAEGLTANLFIEIDSGLHRSGISSSNDVIRLADFIGSCKGARLIGIMTHAGHAYSATTSERVREIGLAEGKIMAQLASTLRQAGHTVPIVSAGSTPTAPIVSTTSGITELRVGNYIFNDMTQVALGVATQEQCALSVLCTVISTHSDRVVIDAGSKAFSADVGAHGSHAVSGYGQLADFPATVTRLSEEHGVIVADTLPFRVGDRIRVIPNHSCPVANLATSMYLVDRNHVIHTLPVDARACVQ